MSLEHGRFLRTPKAAKWLDLSESHLCKLRVQGLGPPYSKVGKAVLYNINDLNAYMAARKRRSTSDDGAG
jgi:hypothetical protein